METFELIMVLLAAIVVLVSLAMALALPLVIVGSPFGLGLLPPWLLRKLKIADDDLHEREWQLAHRVVRQAMFDQYRQPVQESPELVNNAGRCSSRWKLAPMISPRGTTLTGITVASVDRAGHAGAAAGHCRSAPGAP